MLKKIIKLENIRRSWKKIQILINVGPTFIPDYRLFSHNNFNYLCGFRSDHVYKKSYWKSK